MRHQATELLTNPRSERVKSIRALARRSIRANQGQYLAEGPTVVGEALTWRPESIRHLYVDSEALASGPPNAGTHDSRARDSRAATGDCVGDGAAHVDAPHSGAAHSATQERLSSLIDHARQAGVAVTSVTGAVFAAMSDTRTPAGVLAVCRRLDVPLDQVLSTRPRLMAVLAHVRDPGNVGTVIRAADAAGADAVIVSDASVDVYNPKAVRSTAGSLFHLPLVVGIPVEEILAALSSAQIRVLATTAQASVSTEQVDVSGPHAWLFGNEAWGLPQELQDACDERVRVPIYGRAESLNLAMAATVCLYASARAQRNPRPGGESAVQGLDSLG